MKQHQDRCLVEAKRVGTGALLEMQSGATLRHAILTRHRFHSDLVCRDRFHNAQTVGGNRINVLQH